MPVKVVESKKNGKQAIGTKKYSAGDEEKSMMHSSISRPRITITADVQMIDACHIRPWSKTKDDSIQNGIALTPTIHQAFDRGIIRINADYTVAISDDITENENSPFSLKQFVGKSKSRASLISSS